MPSSVAASPSSAPPLATSRTRQVSQRLALGLAATLVIALAAHVALPLPFTPVPFTLQPLAVLAVGLFLGPLDGALALLAYLAEGAAGLPVFSPTGPGGLAQLLGPTGGFLMMYPAVAFLCGWARRFASTMGPFTAALATCTLALLVLFAGGAAWFAWETHLGAHAVWIATIAPFLPGEAVKALAAAGIFRALYSPHRAR